MTTERDRASGRLPAFVLGAFASAALPVGALQLPLAVHLPNYYASHIGLSLSAVGFAFTVVQLIAISFDPALGIAMERTHSRFGRFRPWLMLSVPILIVSALAVFMAPVGAGLFYLVFWLLVFYLGYSMSMLATNSWGAALVPGYHERSRLYAWLQFAGLGGAVLMLMIPPVLAWIWNAGEAAAVRTMGGFLMLAVPLTVFFAVMVVRDPPRPADEIVNHFSLRDYLSLIAQPNMARILFANFFLTLGPSMMGALYFFFFCDARGYSFAEANILLFIYIAAGLGGAPAFAHIAMRLGKHRTIMLAAVINVVLQAVVLALPRASMLLMAPAMFLVGFAANSYALLLNAMVADVCDEVRLETGRDRTPPLYSLMTCTMKIGSAVPVGITYPILALLGFNAAEGAVNTPAAIAGLEWCFVIAPIAVLLLGALAMWGYRLDAVRHREIAAMLAVRDGGTEIVTMESEITVISTAAAP